MVAADPAGGDDDRLRRQFELAYLVAVGRSGALRVIGRQHGAFDPGGNAVGDDQLVNAVPMVEGHQLGLGAL